MRSSIFVLALGATGLISATFFLTQVEADPPTNAVSFRYDLRGRVIEADYHDLNKAIHYQYDSAGNRTRRWVDNFINGPATPLPAYIPAP